MHATDWQTWVTMLLVAGCSSYALWTLMPRAWRGRAAAWCGRPTKATRQGCNGCAGCGDQPTGQQPAAKVVKFVKAAKPVTPHG